MSALDELIRIKIDGDEMGFDDYVDAVYTAREELASLRTRIAELEAKTQWQPIETCPKKGRFLGGSNKVGVAACARDMALKIKYTHWMPLPKPPEEGEK